MKIQNLAVIFVIIMIPILLVLAYYMQLQADTLNLQTTYTAKLLDSTKAAVESFEINTVQLNSDYSSVSDSKRRDVQASVNTFVTTLANNLGITGTNIETFQSYIPAIAYTLYDGYYIYTPAQVGVTLKNSNGVTVFYDIDNLKVLNYSDPVPAGQKEYIRTNSTTIKKGTILYEAKDATTCEGEYTIIYNDETAKTYYFVTDVSNAKKEYSHILKPFATYNARYKDGATDIVVNYTLDNYIKINGTLGTDVISKDGYLLDTSTTSPIKINGTEVTVDNKKIEPEKLTEQVAYKDANGKYNLKTFPYVYSSESKKVYFDESYNGGTFFTLSSADTISYLSDYSTEVIYKKYSVRTAQGKYTAYYQALNGSGIKGKWFESDEDHSTISQSARSKNWQECSDLGLKVTENVDGGTEYSTSDIQFDYSAINYYVENYVFSEWVKTKLSGIKTDMIQGATGLNDNNITVFSTERIDTSVTVDSDTLEGSAFYEQKIELMKESIRNNLQQVIRDYSGQMGGIDFQLPVLKETEWDQLLSNVSVITFFQGVPIGLKYYNNYAIATSTTNAEFVDPDEIYFSCIGDQYYHRKYCSEIKEANVCIGYRSIDYQTKSYTYMDNNAEKTEYYYSHDDKATTDSELLCYNCLVNTAMYEEKVTPILKQVYDTALARERYITREATAVKSESFVTTNVMTTFSSLKETGIISVPKDQIFLTIIAKDKETSEVIRDIGTYTINRAVTINIDTNEKLRIDGYKNPGVGIIISDNGDGTFSKKVEFEPGSSCAVNDENITGGTSPYEILEQTTKIEIVIYYERETYTLTVQYIDEQGNEFDVGGGRTEDTYIRKYKEDYNVEIPKVTGYTETPSNFNGKTMPYNNHIEKVKYTAKLYDLTIRYVDEYGEEIAETKTISNLKYKQEYTANAEDIPKYELAEGEETEKSIIISDDKEQNNITFKYVTKKYTLTIRYEDENGKEIAAPLVITGLEYDMQYAFNAYDNSLIDRKKYEAIQETKEITIEDIDNNELVFKFRIKIYKLTINYLFENDTVAYIPYTKDCEEGEEYDVQSPVIKGYTATEDKITGTMSDESRTFNVKYIRNAYKLKIIYKYNNGDIIKTEEYTIKGGENYSYISPEIEGYKPDRSEVTGVMPDEEHIEEVTYNPNKHNIIVVFKNNEGNELGTRKIENYEYNKDYSIPLEYQPEGYVPIIESVTPTSHSARLEGNQVKGTMPDAEVKITIKYVMGYSIEIITIRDGHTRKEIDSVNRGNATVSREASGDTQVRLSTTIAISKNSRCTIKASNLDQQTSPNFGKYYDTPESKVTISTNESGSGILINYLKGKSTYDYIECLDSSGNLINGTGKNSSNNIIAVNGNSMKVIIYLSPKTALGNISSLELTANLINRDSLTLDFEFSEEEIYGVFSIQLFNKEINQYSDIIDIDTKNLYTELGTMKSAKGDIGAYKDKTIYVIENMYFAGLSNAGWRNHNEWCIIILDKDGNTFTGKESFVGEGFNKNNVLGSVKYYKLGKTVTGALDTRNAFLEFKEAVNAGTTMSFGATNVSHKGLTYTIPAHQRGYYLLGNVNLGGNAFTPINEFNGIFSGNPNEANPKYIKFSENGFTGPYIQNKVSGYQISNLRLTSTNDQTRGVGLFSENGNQGKIKSFVLNNISMGNVATAVSTTAGETGNEEKSEEEKKVFSLYYIGGVAGKNKGLIENVIIGSNVQINTDTITSYSGEVNIGGIAGVNEKDVQYCINYGTMKGAYGSIGNFISDQFSWISGKTNAYGAGGIVGENNGTVMYCGNESSANIYSDICGGGICRSQ